MTEIYTKDTVNVNIAEDETFDVILNGELEVHIKRNDVGYSVDLYRYATQEEMEKDGYDFDGDFISACTALDDDLIRDNDNDKVIEVSVKLASSDGSDMSYWDTSWSIEDENLYHENEVMIEGVIDDNEEIVDTILSYYMERVELIEVDGKEIYNDNDYDY